MQNKVDYANWIPKTFVFSIVRKAVFWVALLGLSFFLKTITAVIILRTALGLLAVFFTGFALYVLYARKALSYSGGGLQSKILDNLISYLDWTGNGSVLDVGCGSGALAVKLANKFPHAKITGMDYWGTDWDYGKKQCEKNAEIEGVSLQTQFLHGDASKLEFSSGEFDAAVSNMVFHEVSSQPDKLKLIQETLRVLKPGGVFVFQDIFFSKKHYDNLPKLISELTAEVTELHFVETRKSKFIPKALSTPLVAGNMGLIYGKK